MVTVEARADGILPRTSNLLLLSPEELCHIYLLAIDESIARGDDEQILLTWKHTACLFVSNTSMLQQMVHRLPTGGLGTIVNK